jgi:hypothetical protein
MAPAAISPVALPWFCSLSLFEVLKSQGMQMNQQVTCVTDGGEDVRAIPL